MSKEEKEYRRLPGRGRSFFGSRRLWLGPDHLMEVEGRGYTETYRRFYYSDIQTILLRGTRRWISVALLLGTPLAAALLALFLFPPEFRPVWAVPAALFSLALATHLGSGRSCVCQIRTIVQTAPLRSLRRRRSALRAIARIRERVGKVQGDTIPAATTEVSSATSASEPGAASAVPPVPASPPVAPPALPARRENGRVHAALFGLLLLDAALTAASLAAPSRAFDIAGQLLLLVQFGFAIAALVRQHRSDLPSSVRGLVWATLGYLSVTVLIVWVSGWITAFRTLSAPAAVASPPGRRFALDTFGLVTPLLLGVAGQFLLHRFRRDRQEGELTILGPWRTGA